MVDISIWQNGKNHFEACQEAAAILAYTFPDKKVGSTLDCYLATLTRNESASCLLVPRAVAGLLAARWFIRPARNGVKIQIPAPAGFL